MDHVPRMHSTYEPLMKNDNHADEFRKVPTIKRSQSMVGGGAAFAPLYAPYNHCAYILVPHTAVTQGVKHERCTPGLLTETQHPSLKATPSKNTGWPEKQRFFFLLLNMSICMYYVVVLSIFMQQKYFLVWNLGAWIARWLDCQAHDQKVSGLSPSRRIYFSRVNFLC